MVIGNGFFSDTESDALREMKSRSGCEVKRCVFPTIGNIIYFISTKGDIYGMQTIQGRKLTRTRVTQKNKNGIMARLSCAPHKEAYYPLQNLTYCSFTLNEWRSDIELTFINGNPFDVRPENLTEKVEVIPKEWGEYMGVRSQAYQSYFMKVAWSVNHTTGLDIQDCKDLAQSAFIRLCTDAKASITYDDNGFVGVWVKTSRQKGIDFLKYKARHNAEVLGNIGRRERTYEYDLFKMLHGNKRQTYARMYFDGYKPTEIAEEFGVSLGAVSSEVTRSVQFMQKYLKRDIDLWHNRRKTHVRR